MKKRLCLMCLLLALLTGLMSVGVCAADYVVTTGTSINLRSTPKIATDNVMKRLDKGVKLEKLGEENGFVKVKAGSATGYVSRDFVTASNGAASAAATPATTPLVTAPAGANKTGRIVCIDAGHQSRANTAKEPIGPGSSEMKMKVTGGTSGVATKLPEYQLTLAISLKLQAELQNRGYSVVMCRSTNDVNMSNSERAQIANNSGAGAFVRVHANGSTNAGANGAMTICPTPNSPYCAGIYANSRRLSDNVLNSLVAATGCKKEYVWETDTMSGINWCKVPVTIVEVGYMSNANEDMLMATDDYQNKMAKGIADGIDKYFDGM